MRGEELNTHKILLIISVRSFVNIGRLIYIYILFPNNKRALITTTHI